MTDSRTADQLVYEAASVLGKLEAGEPLGAVEYDAIMSVVGPVLEEVSGFCYIGDRDAIPLRYFQVLARIVAAYAAAKFSNQQADMPAVQAYEARLRYLSAGASSNEPIQSIYF